MKPLAVVQRPPFSVAVFADPGGGFYLKVDAAKPYRAHNPGQYVIADRAEVLTLVRAVLEAAAARPSPGRADFRRVLAALPPLAPFPAARAPVPAAAAVPDGPEEGE